MPILLASPFGQEDARQRADTLGCSDPSLWQGGERGFLELGVGLILLARGCWRGGRAEGMLGRQVQCLFWDWWPLKISEAVEWDV